MLRPRFRRQRKSELVHVDADTHHVRAGPSRLRESGPLLRHKPHFPVDEDFLGRVSFVTEKGEQFSGGKSYTLLRTIGGEAQAYRDSTNQQFR